MKEKKDIKQIINDNPHRNKTSEEKVKLVQDYMNKHYPNDKKGINIKP